MAKQERKQNPNNQSNRIHTTMRSTWATMVTPRWPHPKEGQTWEDSPHSNPRQKGIERSATRTARVSPHPVGDWKSLPIAKKHLKTPQALQSCSTKKATFGNKQATLLSAAFAQLLLANHCGQNYHNKTLNKNALVQLLAQKSQENQFTKHIPWFVSLAKETHQCQQHYKKILWWN